MGNAGISALSEMCERELPKGQKFYYIKREKSMLAAETTLR